MVLLLMCACASFCLAVIWLVDSLHAKPCGKCWLCRRAERRRRLKHVRLTDVGQSGWMWPSVDDLRGGVQGAPVQLGRDKPREFSEGTGVPPHMIPESLELHDDLPDEAGLNFDGESDFVYIGGDKHGSIEYISTFNRALSDSEVAEMHAKMCGEREGLLAGPQFAKGYSNSLDGLADEYCFRAADGTKYYYSWEFIRDLRRDDPLLKSILSASEGQFLAKRIKEHLTTNKQ